MNKFITMGRPPMLLTTVLTAMAVCCVAGCAKIPNTLTDTRDGKTYMTVKIGKQVWMAENLNYKPESGNSWCYGDNCAEYTDFAKYGRLYDWATAMGGAPSSDSSVRGVCPTGWHLPSNQEWQTLVDFIGGKEVAGKKWQTLVDFIGGREVAGKKLKSTSDWNRNSYENNSGNGTDAYGFSALPGGGRRSDGSFYGVGDYGYWWTATEYSVGGAYLRVMGYDDDLNKSYYDKDDGFSVRCVGDRSAAWALPQKRVGDDKAKIEMVFVKGGTFMMGCTNEQGSDCRDDEKPAHSVTVSDFYIGKYEVTQNQWVKVMGRDNNRSYFKGGNLPVEHVSWNDAQEFILRLNTMTGKKYRLPTEAEWEYAARGGARSKGYKYSGSNSASDVAWYDVNSGDQVLRDGLFEEYVVKKHHLAGYVDILESNKNRTRAVGMKAPNELGIYDMSGNVHEWVNDRYEEDYSSVAQINPSGSTSDSIRVYRGGDWGFIARNCRVSNRFPWYPNGRGYNIGFRLALSP